MKTKILLLSLSVAALGSCTTAYKSSQTPDDVYYSPVKVYASEDDRDNDREKEKKYEPSKDYEIVMGIRDHRWRDFSDDYSYDYSPYNYTCKRYNYGYYYNPFYYPRVIYTVKTGYSKPLNTTPRMVNLNAYNGYNPRVASDKTNGTNWAGSSYRYNNSNSSSGSRAREILYPRSSSSSSSSNDTRTYTPSSSGSSSSGSSSSGRSSGSSVSRPGRG